MRKVVASLLLTLCLVGLFATTAGASPKVGPKIPDCSSWSTVASGSPQYFYSGESITVYLQRASPGYCTTLRSKTVLIGGNVIVRGYSGYFSSYWHMTQDGSVLTCCNYTLYGSPIDYYGHFPGTFAAEGSVFDNLYDTWITSAWSASASLS